MPSTIRGIFRITTLLAILLPVTGIAGTQQSIKFTQTQICRAAIAVAFGQSPGIIKVDRVNAGVIYMHYIRPWDETYWDYKCKIKGNRAIWASPNGRWRDEVLEFTATKDKLIVEEKYFDGSKTTESFTKQQLGK